jgi:sortase A
MSAPQDLNAGFVPRLRLSGEDCGPAHRRRRPRRRLGRARLWLSSLLILAGLALGADVAATLVWQEPVTAVIAELRRSHLDERWARGVPLGRVDHAQLASINTMDARLAYLARRESATAPDGAALGRLDIPRIGLRSALIQGATSSGLELGPAHYRETDLPGEGGTVAVAGHRTTYLAPFKALNELAAGDLITLTMPYGVFTYVVGRVQVVAPDSWWITHDVGHDELVLSSCNPLYSATQRIAVFARLSSVTPRGAAVAA